MRHGPFHRRTTSRQRTKRALCQVLLASLVAAVLAVITAPASFAAEATISWSGTLTVKDTYTHTYSKQATDGDPQSCDGSLVTELSATYRLSSRTATVQADARVWSSYVPIEVTSQSGYTKGRLTCTSQYGSSESTVDGPLQLQAAEPLESLLEYDREADRLAFVHGAGPTTYITAPPVKHEYTNADGSGSNAGHYETPFRAAGPRLEFEPRFGQPLSDYRIQFPRSAADNDLDVTHQNPLSYLVDGGNAAFASNGLPLGNYSNFGGLVGSPISNIALHEEITADLHGVAPSAAPWSTSDVPVMASLGDSYSSGEGAYDYDVETDIPGANHCHRSANAYGRTGFAAMRTGQPSDLQEEYSFACSGAVTTDVRLDEFCGSGCDRLTGRVEPSQIDQLRKLEELPGKRVDLVTLGIGGNDAGFGKVIEACIHPAKGNCVADFDPQIGTEPAGDSRDAIKQQVTNAIVEIKQAARTARIVLVGYPVFISDAYKACPKLEGDGVSGIGPDEAEWLRGQILDMNRALEEVALARAADGVRFLSLDTVYGDNVLCNGGTPDSQWLHGLVMQGREGDVAGGCSIAGSPKLHWGNPCNESFHPKAAGHAATGQALAACVQREECGAASDETVRPPISLNGKPPSWNRQADCASAPCRAVPEEPATVRATGFRPGTQVQVDLHSRSLRLGEGTVAADGSVEVTVTIPAGAVVPGPHKIVMTGPGDSTILRAATLDLTVTCDSGFSDVPPEHPFCADITWLTSTAVTTGYSDGTYRPGIGLSRAQMASFLWRLAGRPPASPDVPTFSDVPAADAHQQAIRWLAARGITTGYGDGTFRPGEGLSRQHMGAFLHRYAGQPAPSPDAPSFRDVPPDSPFSTAISWLAGERITVGKADGSFGPADKLNRQQMAAFLHRFGEPRGLPE